ncbi:SNF2-related protein [Caldimonas sp. KR1-144]|uniref:SNF2-related protein n=1 Tax=Caldimonas sp. KR1-144 TaxID=3400911 RepID=UPI003C10D9BE
MTTLFAHQTYSLDFTADRPEVFDMSEPGTGKTAVHLLDFARRYAKHGHPGIIFATKSLLQSAWANDAAKFVPDLPISVAWAENREEAFEKDAALYITNHDAVKWLAEHKPKLLKRLLYMGTDESTAYKHSTSQRSKAAMFVRNQLPRNHPDVAARNLSGTPSPNGILDLWHQAYLLDFGKRLGASYFKFRAATCDAVQVGPKPEHVQWVQREGAEEAVAALLADITIRHELRACVDMPEQVVYTVPFKLTPKHRAIYEKMEKDMLVDVGPHQVIALNGAVLYTKLLQIASGSVYGQDDEVSIDQQRYELVMDLAEQRRHSLVLFQWGHQRRALTELADKRGLSFAVIDGSTSAKERASIVERYQAGFIRILFGHPQSMGHGLTLTRGTATIWASPTINQEWWEQANRRIFRIGQTERTETIVVCAQGTIDEVVTADREVKEFNAIALLNALKSYRR